MHKCIVCGKDLDESTHLMLFENMPAGAQGMPDESELENEKSMDLQLCQCPSCGLVQFDCEPVGYYKDVIRAGGYSSTMSDLRHEQYKHFIETCNLQGRKIIEIGCGQGEFLDMLRDFPVEGYGIEHSAKLVKMALDKGLNVWEDFAESGDTKLANGPFDAFLSFNFLEHQPDPNGMMQCIYNNLTDGGVGLVTVPNFEYILENNAFYELLRDHIANYTADTLTVLMNRNGFDVIEKTVVNRDTISFIVKKRTKIDISGIKSGLDTFNSHVRDYIVSRVGSGKKLAVWGASHQSFTTLSTSGVGDKVSYIIDSAPFKQGKFSPASHVPIVSPDYFHENPVDSILIIAPGYTDEIHSIIINKFGEHIEVGAIRTETIEVL